MNDFGENTDTTGGTRYSSGKPVMTWLPWRGIYHAWAWGRVDLDYGKSGTLRSAIMKVDYHLAQAMNLHESWQRHASLALYWLLAICHWFVVNRYRDSDLTVEDPELEVETYPALGVWEVARVSIYGAGKYAEFDWYEGQAFSTLLSSARRHVDKTVAFGPLSMDEWHGDEPQGTEYSGLLHAAHAAWNLACLLHFVDEGRQEELDDVSVWHGIVTSDKLDIAEYAEQNTDKGTPLWKAARKWQEEIEL